jgi:nicotinamide-nucleotide amidase
VIAMSFFPVHISDLATEVLAAARSKKLRIVTAESCTGGLIGAALTEIAGSSDVVDCGFTSYSYDAKVAQLGINRDVLVKSGAVSADIALQMVKGALAGASAEIAISATGIAGPGGATPDKPVGLVYIGVGNRVNGHADAVKNIFSGDRSAVRMATVEKALQMLKQEIGAI